VSEIEITVTIGLECRSATKGGEGGEEGMRVLHVFDIHWQTQYWDYFPHFYNNNNHHHNL